MSHRVFIYSLWCGILPLLTAPSSFAAPVDFNRDIRPLLAERCFQCHGPDTSKNKADLRLDLEYAAKEFAISPGDVEDSDFITRISSTDPDEHMPPPDSGKEQFSPEDVSLFTRWIEEGAVWNTHWAWSAPERIEPTPIEGGRNEIDHIVLARLSEKGLSLSKQASK